MTKTTQDVPTDAVDYEEALRHYDVFDHSQDAHKWELLRWAREHSPVTYTEENTGMWVVSRYDDVRRVLEDWETFSSTQVSIVPLPEEVSMCPLTTDPPVQTVARKLLNPLFSRGALQKWVPAMQETAQRLIDSWIDEGEVEVLSQFAGPYVGEILARIVFTDMDERQLTKAAQVAVAIGEDPTPELFAELFTMAAEYLATAREKDPAAIDSDLLASLLSPATDLSERDKVGVLAILINGGLDTTRAAIGSIVYRMTQEQGIEDRLKDPNWVKRDLDEFLRLDSPVAAIARVATREVELNGVTIKEGERVQVRFDSANRDANRFHDPEALVFDEARPPHAAFGMGVHRCVGSNLARLQIETAFAELFKRVENIRLAPGADPQWVFGNANCLDTVRIAFDRRQDR